ncbi:hypothetical protein I5M32_15395 [Pedobacter sp. SD-b]|uniref:Secretion system C-terminal sorting domain-containing protein n=2 Tax=Pedobacter segetis TaxID=2793069 RepID=A0ABS1BNQ1_9SPHI|nr:hypothetical protein [Pedobacter segetis]
MNKLKRSCLKKAICLISIAVAFTFIANAQTVRYVKTTATGNGDGSSWANASSNIQTMIDASDAGDGVWVKGGTYIPSEYAGNGTTDRDKSFVLKANIKVYGGFAGTESTLTQRDLSLTANESILSGDLDGNDGPGYTNYDDNAYHVVIITGAVGNVVLSGFTIKGGNANTGGTITVNSKSISRSNGGGIYNFNDAFDTAPLLSNLSILSNRANSKGGGIYNNLTSTRILNVAIKGNYAYLGGGIYNVNSGTAITNVLISGNSAIGGGALYFTSSNPVITNATISGNKAGDGGAIYNSDVIIKIRNSIIYGNSYGIYNTQYVALTNSYSNIQTSGTSSVPLDIEVIDGGNNLNTDPLFIDAPDASTAPFTGGDYRLKSNSPTIGAGNNIYYNDGQNPNLSSITTDLAGNARINMSDIDMGVYEYLVKPNVNGIAYVTPTGSGDFSGDSWTNATANIQFAIDATATQQVWVKGGNYIPSEYAGNGTTDRHKAFLIKENVKVYGGFAGTESNLNERDLSLSANKSILNGDLGADDGANFSNSTENAYHVVISAGTVGTAELNGFTIQGGNANTGSNTILVNGKNILASRGGGIYNVDSSPLLTNLSIISNQALFGGGVRNDNSNPILTNVTINGNSVANNGGGINNDGSSPILTNVIISGNAATSGAGMYNNNGSNTILTNVTISGNAASTNGGAMYNTNSSVPLIRNCIIYGNNSSVFNNSATPSFFNSIIEGSGGSTAWLSSTGTDGGNNLDVDPSFVNAPLANTAPFSVGDYHLTKNSYAVGSGDNTFFNSAQTPDLNAIVTDIDGNGRIQKTFIDMGAYESNYNISVIPDANGIAYVTPSGAGKLNGSSWANATDNIQYAINATTTQQVWAKGGTYIASVINGSGSNNRDKAFLIYKNVKVYGGFAGTESNLSERDLSLSTNESILSGDLNGDDGPNFTNYGDNVLHVVMTTGSGNTALLDGFTIKGGNTGGNGGGISSARAGMKFNNLLVKENRAGSGGGLDLVNATVLTNSTVSGNISSNNSYGGGGIYSTGFYTSQITNVVISGNTTGGFGGGVYISSGKLVFTNVTISGNKAKSGNDNGGGIWIYPDGSASIRNSIIYGNSSKIIAIAGFGTSVTSSIYQKNSFVDDDGNNLDNVDPLFVDAPDFSTAPFIGGDYHIKAGSPAIGAGDSSYFDPGKTPDLSAIATDLDGNVRSQGGIINMGAYETFIPLPVKLISFSVKPSGNFAQLNWQTATETNNNYFTISKSTDGKSFEQLSTINSKGNSGADYATIDFSPFAGLSYYKLSQTDRDGKTKELGIRTLKLESLDKEGLLVYPNPVVNGIINIQGQDLNGLQNIAIYDLTGKEVCKNQVKFDNGLATYKLSNIKTGVYVLNISNKSMKIVVK